MIPRSKRCAVPGCKNRGRIIYSGSKLPENITKPIRICRTCHKYRVKKKTYSKWASQSWPFAAPKTFSAGCKHKTENSPPKKGARRGKDARRALFTAWKKYDCVHPYSKVRWDIVYKVARCTACGASVKRSKKNRDKYVSKKNQRNKPVLDVKYYSRKEITLGTAMNMFFFQRTIMDVTWEDAVSIARAIKPGTKFSASSFSWYRNHFIQRHMTRKEVTSMGRGDKKKKKHGKKKVKKVVTKKAAKAKSGKKKKATIQSIVLAYFDQVGPEKAKYEKTKARVLKVHPDSAFNASHMGWYRAKWRELNE